MSLGRGLLLIMLLLLLVPGNAAAEQSLEAAIINASAIAEPSVVRVESSTGLGSGVIISSDGYVITNYHVIASSLANGRTGFTVTLSTGAMYGASIKGVDPLDDLALLKIAATGLRAIQFGESGALKVGQFVLAVGNPLGFSHTVTLGIVSTLRRAIPEGAAPGFIPDMIQTSVPINPGNSGGALVDISGKLVGIPNIVAVDPRLGTAAQGIGFAIPAERVKFVVSQLLERGRLAHSGRPYFGISQIVERRGILVGSIVTNGPADRAGIRNGDTIVRVNEHYTFTLEAFGDAVSELRPGQTAKVQVLDRFGRVRTLSIELGELPLPRS